MSAPAASRLAATASRLALALWAILAAGCRPPVSSASSAFAFDPARLDAARAYEEVRRFVAHRPRDATTEGAALAAAYLHTRLQALGVDASIDAFEDQAPSGLTTFRNVIGRLAGRTDGIIILSSHYDTKAGLGPDFEGANDSGSSSGLVLELARSLTEQADDSYDGPDILFVFFDGEEALKQYGPSDGFHGSRHMAGRLVEEGRKDDVLAVINLDMVGDRDLTVTLPRNATPSLLATVLEAAHAEDVRSSFSLAPYTIRDDHDAFFQLGMPAVNIIDFEYGSARGHNDYWHTPEDRMDKISAESLGRVGRVTVRVVNDVLRRRALPEKTTSR